tara:strand:+ start:228 stop:746 length:519 start_codon:yes stop_codon:yes gene_type:complete
MALWGSSDLVYTSDGSGSSVAVSGVTITGTGTTFNTAGLIAAGDVITIGAGASCGEGIVASVNSATSITLVNADNIVDTGHTITGESFEVVQKPISTLGDTNYGANEIFGVSVAEEEAARGDTSPYRPAHAGWVGITSYTDMHGNLRVKTETLVAKSTITADASDDTILPDS